MKDDFFKKISGKINNRGNNKKSKTYQSIRFIRPQFISFNSHYNSLSDYLSLDLGELLGRELGSTTAEKNNVWKEIQIPIQEIDSKGKNNKNKELTKARSSNS